MRLQPPAVLLNTYSGTNTLQRACMVQKLSVLKAPEESSNEVFTASTLVDMRGSPQEQSLDFKH